MIVTENLKLANKILNVLNQDFVIDDDDTIYKYITSNYLYKHL